MSWTELLVAVLSLTTLEVVLGIDNLVLLALITQPLPKEKREKAQRIGLLAALGTRLLLLAVVSLLMRLNEPLFSLPGWLFREEGEHAAAAWRARRASMAPEARTKPFPRLHG